MSVNTAQAPLIRPAFALTGACAVALAAMAAAPSFAEDKGDDLSHETRAIIMGPLYQEMTATAPANPGARLPAAPRAAQLRYSPASAPASDTSSPRPAAARFADAALIARTDSVARDRLAAFAGDEATLAFSPSGTRVSLSLYDGEAPDAAFLNFRPDYAAAAGRALYGETDRARRMAVRLEQSFDTTGADGLDYGLTPSAGVSVSGDGAALETGATVRLGKYIDTDFDRPAWWFFAGADRQAVMYDPNQGFDVRQAVAMEPYAIVGDAQAGVAMRMGGADFSIAYVHRETEFSMPNESWETREGFAAFSLTWRR